MPSRIIIINWRIIDISITIECYYFSRVGNNRIRLNKVSKLAVIPPGVVPVQINVVIGQLAGVAVLGGGQAAAVTNLTEGGITNLGVPGAVLVGGEGGGAQVVGNQPLEGVGAVLDGAHGDEG